MASDGLHPIALMVDEMKSEDTEARINAMRKLKIIAQALGPERTRKELIPYLNEQVEDDDEVLLVLAEELGGFLPLVGGAHEAVCLIGPLGALATVEETVVRDRAVESACIVIRGLEAAAIVEHVVPVIQKLAQGDWFTARVSACGLFAAAYERLGDAATAKATLRGLYATLAQDDTPMVRRAAAKNIGGLATVVERDYVMTDLLPLFNTLAGDDQDSVRLLAIENCTAFARVLSTTENAGRILPLVMSCAADKSWRVRNNVAKEFFPLSEAMGSVVTRTDLLPAFVKLLQDPEAEVRASAAKNVSGFVSLVGTDKFLSDMLPVIRDCCVDTAQNVRVALAESLMEVASHMTHEQAVGTVVPLILQLLKDEAPDVRLKVLETMAKIVDTLGPEFVESAVLPILLSLHGDLLWRVREQILLKLPLLAKTLGADVFDSKLMPVFMETYTDQVSAVRMTAAKCLEPLARTLGRDWIKTKMVPRMIGMFEEEGGSYLQRISVLYGVRELSVHEDLMDLADELRFLLFRGLKDPVPNVRFVAAQVAEEIVRYCSPSIADTLVKPALAEAAQGDGDADVRFFANKALEHCMTLAH